MRLVVQRVKRAEVRLPDEDGRVTGRICAGMLVLLCVLVGDREVDADELASKLAGYRFFDDEAGRMNLSALELGLPALVVSQFTLAADGRKGRRPSFDAAADPERANALYLHFIRALEREGLAVERGCFGAEMEVELIGDGPVTLILEQPRTSFGQSTQVLT